MHSSDRFFIFNLAITIPSSTKIPITTIIPNRDIKLIVMSNSPAKINIPKNEIGILGFKSN